MLIALSLTLLACSAAASLFFDLLTLVSFFPGTFTNYELYIFDHENFFPEKNLSQAYLDVTSHYSIANMLTHSVIFFLLIYFLLRLPSFKSWGIIFAYFLLALGTKMFFFISLFNFQKLYYLPFATLFLGGLGFTGVLIHLLLIKARSLRKRLD